MRSDVSWSRTLSGIFGIINLRGGPVSPEQLAAMRASMGCWGPHGSATWHEQNAGLGHLLLRNTPEARYESLPRHDVTNGLTLTAHVRLDNRLELFRWLGIPESERATMPDSELILRAYRHWETECVHHLIGDWAFALWDQRKRRLFLARDHHGVSGIYYLLQPGRFVFASAIKGLLALGTTPRRPNLFRLAQVLTSWPGDGVQTAYEEIQRLPPAHTLSIEVDKLTTQRYWSPQAGPPLRLKTDEEYVEAFVDVYQEAVSSRLRSQDPIGATLSGGLDSGSVCALAARELRARSGWLSVFTAVPIYPTTGVTGTDRLGDETPLVEASAKFIGNLDLHYIRAEDFSPLAGLRRYLDLHDEPGHAAGNAFWIHALLEEAQRLGLGVLLTGQGGNGTVSWSGGKSGLESFWPYLRSGKWTKFRQRMQESDLSLWRTIRRHLLAPVVIPARERAKRYRYPGREPWSTYSAINSRLARSLDLTRQMYASAHDPFFTPNSNPGKARLDLILPGADVVGSLLAEDGAGYGLEVRDPTIDKRLMEFCLALPDEQYRQNGMDRLLMRRAMKGLLPDHVRLNRQRCLQAADLGYRLQNTLPEVESMMARISECELAREVLDLPKMNRVIAGLRREVNATTTEESVTILTRGMMVGMFLLRF